MQDHPSLGGARTGKIPNSKKPKARPPRSFRDHVLFPGRALPAYTGPYPVGTMEIEVPAERPRAFSHIRRNGRHILQLETVLMTVYYPAVPTDDAWHNQKQTKYSRELWLGRPRMSIAAGYGQFAGVGPLAIPIFVPTMWTKLPAYRNTPVSRAWAPEIKLDTGSKSKKQMDKRKGAPAEREGASAGREDSSKANETEPKPKDAPDQPVFPMILFTHGLGGTRTMYSSVCGEFASYGFVVCAVEHRDGSGPRTYINHPKPAPGQKDDEMLKNPDLDHTRDEWDRGFDIIDYTFPKDNPTDTSPHNEKGVDRDLRQAQIELRMAELEEAYRVMCELEKGNGEAIAAQNMRREGYKGSSRHGLRNVDWSRWKGCVQTQNVTICGHSFGAATAVEVLRHGHARFPYISQGIIYDIWGASVRPTPKAEEEEEEDASGGASHRIQAPIIAINSEAFTYWPQNFALVESLVREAQQGPTAAPAWLMTLRGTVHVSQSDFSLLYPNVCSLFLKAVANPRRALDLNINASLEFLSHVLPGELARVNRAYKNENLLEADISPLSRIPSFAMHKPEEKWLAMRLEIRHEWLYRLSPKLFRKVRRWDNKRQHRDDDTGDEIWLHMKPSARVLEEHLRRTPGRSTDIEEDLDDGLSKEATDEEDGGHKESTEDHDETVKAREKVTDGHDEPSEAKGPPHTDSKDWTASADAGN